MAERTHMRFHMEEYICKDENIPCTFASKQGICIVSECCRWPRLKTNADRIREMSDEELADILSSPCLGCVVKECKLHNYGSYDCKKAFLGWLKQPVEG